MNEGEMFGSGELPEIEVVQSEDTSESREDLAGQIQALDTEIQALEDRYNEAERPRIEALKREKMRLQEMLNSQK